MTIIKTLQNISACQTLSDVDQLLRTAMESYGCDEFTYNYYPADYNQHAKAKHVVCTQEITAWQAHYVAERYDQVDPMMKQMRSHSLPFGWQVEDELIKYHGKQKRLYCDALDFGLRGGFAVPIHAPLGEFANLVVQDTAILQRIAKREKIKFELQLLGTHYHARVSDLLKAQQQIQTHLTPREIECLRLTSQQKTAKEIASLLHLSVRTVGFHLENAIKKLGVANKYQALIKAIQENLL